MKEVYKFRFLPECGRIVLGPDYVPVKNPSTGKEEYFAEGIVGDPLYQRIEEADRSFAQSSDRSLLAGWDIRYNKRIYTGVEIERAQLFVVQLFGASAASEEFGTWYTDGVPNNDCGVFETNRSIYDPKKTKRCAISSRQVGPLRFPFQKMRKGCDIFMLWGGELVVSERLAQLIENGRFTGGRVQPIWNTGVDPKTMPSLSDVPTGVELLKRANENGFGPADKVYWSWLEEDAQLPLLDKALWEQMELQQSRRAKASPAASFAQLTIQSTPLAVSEKTLFGSMPFRPGSGESCNCEFGEVRGKGLLSPLSVIGSSWDGSDICRSDFYLGSRGGLFRPWRPLVISKRLFDAMRQVKMKGFDFEVVEVA